MNRVLSIFVAILCCYLGVSTAECQSSCLQRKMELVLRSEPVHPLLEITDASKSLTAKQLGEIRDAIFEVSKKINGLLATPSTLRIEASSVSTNMGSIIDKDIIQVAYRLQSERGATKHPILSRALIQHEYAHQIFHKELGVRFPELESKLQRLLLQKRELNDQITALTHARIYARREVAHLPLEQQASALAAKRNGIDAQIEGISDALQPIFRDIDEINTLTGPYSEFFSDVVPVLINKEAAVIRKGLFFSGDSNAERAAASARDFSKRIRINKLDQADEHVLMSPARAYVWKHYLSTSLHQKTPGPTLRKIMDAISDELRIRMTNPSLQVLSPEQTNQRLIEAIDNRFSLKK